MTSFKTLAILILGFALFQATLASSHCMAQVFKNSLDDKDQDKMWIWHWNDQLPSYSAPFDGMSEQLYTDDPEPRTLSSFRVMVVELSECGDCTVVGYSGKNLSGKRHEAFVDNSIGGTNGRVDFDFCVKSFTLECVADYVEEEEIGEEEEEEEQQQQQ